jgi:hypothetical protein
VSLFDSLGVIVDSVWVNVTVYATNVSCLGGQCNSGGGGDPADGSYGYKVNSCDSCNSMYVSLRFTSHSTGEESVLTDRCAGGDQIRHRVLCGQLVHEQDHGVRRDDHHLPLLLLLLLRVPQVQARSCSLHGTLPAFATPAPRVREQS